MNYIEQKKKEFEEKMKLNLKYGGIVVFDFDDKLVVSPALAIKFLESSLTELLEKAKECVPEYINNRNVNSKSYEIDLGHDGCIEKFLQALSNLQRE